MLYRGLISAGQAVRLGERTVWLFYLLTMPILPDDSDAEPAGVRFDCDSSMCGMKFSSSLRIGAIGLLAIVALALSACSPALSPLYRDYQLPESSISIDGRVNAALEDAGWDTVGIATPNAITTEERTLSHWGIYRVVASLEVTPLGSDHVRVFVHPYRRYFTGGRGKIPYLTRSIRSKFLPALNEAFKEQGLVAVGTPLERDEDSRSD